MAELNSRDRLQPSLLDRLIDDAPQQRTEALDARALTRQQLRAAVLRDLSWLFNAIRNEPEPNSSRRDDLALWKTAPEARRSVLNYGMPAFAGVTLASMDTKLIEREVTEAIKAFEPRIDPKTLSIEVKIDPNNHHNMMQLVIRGQMWSQPVPLELLLAADVDVETGSTRVRELRR
ncbi:type VI secretion system baseplate subunit TssE [Paucibacter sp. R3-3]|uniref:Type VI secretion system baseplate subunit TssE n=1 Tax=Roseateles agri TaxID=3098619 RepID=A0ABU5DI53_9BURK|nr:type VI secretion system baseplate subunit TssE [Paucibacter sp. R3-3]MDY0745970.1 type VI secretion system baseplate subunit TssE [Paucibacter sp. R3-3]